VFLLPRAPVNAVGTAFVSGRHICLIIMSYSLIFCLVSQINLIWFDLIWSDRVYAHPSWSSELSMTRPKPTDRVTQPDQTHCKLKKKWFSPTRNSVTNKPNSYITTKTLIPYFDVSISSRDQNKVLKFYKKFISPTPASKHKTHNTQRNKMTTDYTELKLVVIFYFILLYQPNEFISQ